MVNEPRVMTPAFIWLGEISRKAQITTPIANGDKTAMKIFIDLSLESIRERVYRGTRFLRATAIWNGLIFDVK